MAMLLGMLFVLVGTALGYDVRTNQFVDTLIRGQFQNELRTAGMEPNRLSTITTLDKGGVFGSGVTANTTYTNGWLSGLSRVNRWGDCSNLYYKSGYRALNCTIYFPSLMLNYDGQLRYGFNTYNLHTSGNMTNLSAFLEVVAPSVGAPRVNYFALTVLPTPRMTYTGLWALSSDVPKVLEKSFIQGVNPQTTYVINTQVRYVLDRSVPYVPFPM